MEGPNERSFFLLSIPQALKNHDVLIGFTFWFLSSVRIMLPKKLPYTNFPRPRFCNIHNSSSFPRAAIQFWDARRAQIQCFASQNCRFSTPPSNIYIYMKDENVDIPRPCVVFLLVQFALVLFVQ